MTGALGTPPGPESSTSRTPDHVRRLGVAFAMAFTAGPIAITAGPLLGRQLSPDPALATLPLAVQLLSMMAAGIPASLLMERIGRRRGFQITMAIGVVGSLLVAWPGAGFTHLLVGSACIGLMLGATQLFRFAAADMVTDVAFKAKAVGTVMVGGVVAAVLGPLIVIAMDAVAAQPLTSAYATIGILEIGAIVILQFIRFAPMVRRPSTPSNTAPIDRHPIVVGIASAVVGYMAMSLVMTATPLAMTDAGFSVRATSLVIMGHALAMFGPSFWTGGFVQRFGAGRVAGVGWIGLVAACLVNALDLGLVGFALALILLGVGWNCMFVAGTSLVAAHQPAQGGARLQGVNDLFVLGSAAAASLLSGVAFAALGWLPLQWWIIAGLIVAGVALWQGATKVAARPRPVP